MKKRVLLVDESLTVQKVVALTLDRNRYQVSYAKSRSEAMRLIVETVPDLILVSDQVPDVAAASFPREVETWLARRATVPPMVLITAQDVREMRQYAGVLKKPFSPQSLQAMVAQHAKPSLEEEAPRGAAAAPPPAEDVDDQRLQKIFNEAFADEAKLVRETFRAEMEKASPTMTDITLPNALPNGNAGRRETDAPPADELWSDAAPARRPEPARPQKAADAETLWDAPEAKPTRTRPEPPSGLMGASDSMAYKAVLENKVQDKLESDNLEEVVERVLQRILPNIVERLVQERLDKLLKEQEQFIELKP